MSWYARKPQWIVLIGRKFWVKGLKLWSEMPIKCQTLELVTSLSFLRTHSRSFDLDKSQLLQSLTIYDTIINYRIFVIALS